MSVSAQTRKFIVAALLILSVFAPLFWWISAGADINDKLLVQKNGLCLLFVFIFVSQFWIERASKHSKNDLIVAVIFLVAAAHLLVQIIGFAGKSPNHDYNCIVDGANSVLQGYVPYKAVVYALYPPLYAQIMAASFYNIEWISNQFGIVLNQAQIWRVIYYLFQNLQMAGVIALLYLANRFAQSICRFGKLEAALIVCATLTLSFSVLKTLIYTQVNIFLTCIIFFALAFANRMDCARGFALAVGTFIKIYPILLVPPLLVARQWKVCGWTAIWAIALFGISLIGFGPGVWTAWNASVHSYIDMTYANAPAWFYEAGNSFATTALITRYLPIDRLRELSSPEIAILATGFKCVIGIWFLWRYIQRHRPNLTADTVSLRRMNLYDDACDFLTFGFIAGPTALQEQYVMTLPIILWTMATSGRREPFLVMLGTMMMIGFRVLAPLAPIGLCILAYTRQTRRERQKSDNMPDSAKLESEHSETEVAELAKTAPSAKADQGFVSTGLASGAFSGGTLSC